MFAALEESAESMMGERLNTGPPTETGGYFRRPVVGSMPKIRFVCEAIMITEPGKSEGAARSVAKVALIQAAFCCVAPVAPGVAEISSVNTVPLAMGWQE